MAISSSFPTTFSVETLVVAGGGGGGNNYNLRGAGGGAGGLVYVGNLVIPAGSTANVVVGTGGLISARGGDSAIVPYVPTYSHWFNGYSQFDYLTATSSTFVLSLGTGDFTVEAWIYLNTYAATYTGIVDTRTGAVAQPWVFGLNGTSLDFYWGTGATVRATSSMRVPSGQWTHVAATRQSGTVYLYINGYRDATSVSSVTANVTQSSSTFWIGNLRDGAATGQNTYSANVYISNLRTVAGIAAYTGNFTPQTTNLSTSQSPGANIAEVTASSAILGLSFNGSTQYLTVNASSLALAASDYFTIEFWMYTPTQVRTAPAIFSTTNNGGGAGHMAFFVGHSGLGITNQYGLYWVGMPAGTGGAGTTTNLLSSTITRILNAWTHIAIVRSGSAVTLYINGTSNATVTYAGAVNFTNNTLYVGTSGDSIPGSDYTGYISNFRIVKGVAVYTGNFTPRTGLAITQSASGNIAAITGTQTSILTLTGIVPILDITAANLAITNINSVTTSPTSPILLGSGTTFLTLQNNTLVDNGPYNLPITKYLGSVSPSIFSQTTPVTDGYASVYFDGATMLQYTNSTALTTQYPAIDVSANGFIITSTGPPTAIAAAPAITPLSAVNSISFSGSSQKLTLPASSAFDLSAATTGSTWTLEWWMYSLATPTSGNQCRIFMAGTNGDAAGWDIGYDNNGSFGWYRPYTTGSPVLIGAPAGTIALSTWYHIAVVCNAGSARIYVNGVSVAGPTAITLPSSASQGLRIGYDDVGTVNFQYNGYLSNIRLVKGVAVYTGNFTVPTAPLATTQSSSANIAAITGSQTSLLIQAISSNSWTAECWVYPSGDYSVYRTIFAKRVTTSGTTEFEGYLRLTTGVISFFNGTNYESTTTLTANTWSHCAWVYTGTNIVIYVNGTQVYTSAVTITTNTEPLVIGGARGYSEYFLGYLSNFRFTRGIVYTGAFTRPTTPLRATQTVSGNIAAITGNAASSTSLLVLQSSTYKDNSVNNYLYGYTYTINTGTPIIKTDVTPFIDSVRGIIAYGGGAGGFNDSTNNATTGGSSGASWNPGYTPAPSSQPTTSYYNGTAYTNTGFGNVGGAGGGAQPYGGGGGGAGRAGYDYNGIVPGGGGNGRQYTISGAPVYYAGGGSSAGYYLNAGYMINPPGLGGGGTGDNSPNLSSQQPGGYTATTSTVYDTANGSPYTGGGGGSGGTGGSGIVIMRYLGPQMATGGTVTSIGGYTIHTFTSNGTFTVAANISVSSFGGNGGPYAGGGGGAAGYLAFGGNGAPGTSIAAGSYGAGGGAGGGGSSATYAGGGGGVDIWGLGGTSGSGGTAGNPGTGGSAEVILGITGNGAQPGFGSNGGLYGGGGGGAVISSLDTTRGWGAGGAFALIYSNTAGVTYSYPYISPQTVTYPGLLQTTNTTVFTSNISAVVADSNFDQLITGDINLKQTQVNIAIAYDSAGTNNTALVYKSVLLANNIIASDTVVAVNYQAEWMLKNSDPAFPATYDRPFNYQTAQPITTTNDPRKLTLKAAYITLTGSQQDPIEPDSFL